MTATSHALTGALIASALRQPLIAIPVSFLSHFVCDALPHLGVDMKFGDKKMRLWLLIDGLLVIFFAITLILIGVDNPVLLAVCGFVAMSPDLVWLFNGLRGISPESPEKLGWFSRFHAKIQKYESIPGVFVDIVWSLSAFILITWVN